MRKKSLALRLIPFLALATALSLFSFSSSHPTARRLPSADAPPFGHIRIPSHRAPAQQEVGVAAAADLRFAMDSVIRIFMKDNPGIVIKATYGSSGNFFAQITNGAPFDLFFSADMDYPQKLADQNLTLSPVKQYAIGQIALWSKQIDPAERKMNILLNTAITKIAIANPDHAPYGKRAEESLRYYNLYDKIKDKLVFGENISQTAQYVSSGAADIGILALSLASSPEMKEGKYWVIPAESHQPLNQGYALLQHAKENDGAQKFADFIGTATAIAILKYFGLGN
jgi:molybdate transport system substrate-binding protein